jgi:hypothetical protein
VSPEIATSINMHVPFSLSRILMSGLLLGMLLLLLLLFMITAVSQNHEVKNTDLPLCLNPEITYRNA